MAILSAQKIKHLCIDEGMISPFVLRSTSLDGLSYGLGPASYDVRIAQDTSLYSGQFALASTLEQFRMPTWVAASVKDKSTWARQGVSVFNTFIDPGWRGFLTLELVNHSSVGIFIPKGTPIAQIVFEELDATTNVPYDGKYQDQEWGAVSAR